MKTNRSNRTSADRISPARDRPPVRECRTADVSEAWSRRPRSADRPLSRIGASASGRADPRRCAPAARRAAHPPRRQPCPVMSTLPLDHGAPPPTRYGPDHCHDAALRWPAPPGHVPGCSPASRHRHPGHPVHPGTRRVGHGGGCARSRRPRRRGRVGIGGGRSPSPEPDRVFWRLETGPTVPCDLPVSEPLPSMNSLNFSRSA